MAQQDEQDEQRDFSEEEIRQRSVASLRRLFALFQVSAGPNMVGRELHHLCKIHGHKLILGDDMTPDVPRRDATPSHN